MGDWLRAGYPEDVPGPDRVPLLALLRSTTLTEDQINEIVRNFKARDSHSKAPADYAIDHDEIAEFVADDTDYEPSAENIHRVACRLAAAGWPLASNRYRSEVVELRTDFRDRLDEIDALVTRMLDLVCEDITAAGAAFLAADAKAAGTVETHNAEIDDLYTEVEDLVRTQFVRQAPIAGDLRFLLIVFRILPELAGASAIAAQIARGGVTGLAAELPARVRTLIGQLIESAAQMWRDVNAVYLTGSVDIADDTEDDDHDLDELFARLNAELVSADLRPPVILEMGSVGRSVERLGDHAVEVARHVALFTPEDYEP
jgi:phosphate uptake regulator